MKKKNLFGLLLSVAMLASCNSKNPESSSQPSSVTSSSSTSVESSSSSNSVESSSSSKVEEKVTVTFDADNGVLTGSASLSIKKGEKIDQSQIPTASKDKHAFRFWAKRGETTAFDFNTVITDNLELIAIYQADTFTITYEGLKDSETHNNRTLYSSDTPTFTLQAPAFNREGYEFDSWLDEEGRPISSVIQGSTGNRRFTASFKVINYTITYSGLEGAKHSNPTSYNVEKETFMLSNPSPRSGYTFTGWEDRGLKVTYISKGTTGNLTLTATWDTDAYSITYENVDGATNPNPVSYSVEDMQFTLLPATKKGYTFKHWEESGVRIDHINPSESTG
ncbi:MAG: InlB B-repeat-containing protein, partial [Candidatus Enterosoma sp.]|nr:InlB B-repeat-containing protein [Candidatus Enterosoma sp.]